MIYSPSSHPIGVYAFFFQKNTIGVLYIKKMSLLFQAL